MVVTLPGRAALRGGPRSVSGLNARVTWDGSASTLGLSAQVAQVAKVAPETSAVPVRARPVRPPARDRSAGQNVRPSRYLRTDIEDDWTSERI